MYSFYYEEPPSCGQDILGYGVPPEYLIDCELSNAMIYYVFSELNLRLPSNLE